MFKFYHYIESSDELKKLSIHICTIWNAISLYETFNSLKLLGPIFISHYVNTMVMLSMCIIKYITKFLWSIKPYFNEKMMWVQNLFTKTNNTKENCVILPHLKICLTSQRLWLYYDTDIHCYKLNWGQNVLQIKNNPVYVLITNISEVFFVSNNA